MEGSQRTFNGAILELNVDSYRMEQAKKDKTQKKGTDNDIQ